MNRSRRAGRKSADRGGRLHGLGLAAAFLLSTAIAGPLQASTVEDAGGLRIGLAFVPFWGPETTRVFTEEGFEAALAEELGRQLGRDVELVELRPTQQDAALAEGTVDAVVTRLDIASSALTQNGGGGFSQGTGAVIETGFQSGLNVAMPTFTTIRDWKDLAGKVVCVSKANERAQKLASSLGASKIVRRAPAEALIGVRVGECDAAIHDDAVLEILLATAEWQKFSSTLTPTSPATLAVAVSDARPGLAGDIRTALAEIGSGESWARRKAQWAADVAFEVYLNQVGNDCH